MPSRKQRANAIRALSMDAVCKAKSGHSGMPMGMADIAEVLWNDYLVHDPAHTRWINRDRFVLSNGHGSMLLYSLLHLTGYDLSIEEIKNFRQLHSKTPGHPEFEITPGVETTTGPLGQGLANAVGMAIAERTLAAQFNRANYPLIDHHTYVFMGDGCLMEGISHEACSLAGVLGLGKLTAFWDDNGISIDGEISGWCNDDVPTRFMSYGWHVIAGVDGHNPDEIKRAIDAARVVTDKPSLICCKTQIGYGAPTMAGSHEAHGAITSETEIKAAKEALGWSYAPFEIPADIYESWDARPRGAEKFNAWQKLWAAYEVAYPELAAQFSRRIEKQLPTDFEDAASTLMQTLQQQTKPAATRKSSQVCLNTFLSRLPELIGGSADLTESNCTYAEGSRAIDRDTYSGNYIYYGVREFGMSAVMNGIALHGGFVPYGGTFLTFCDYARNAVRMAALMKQQVVFVYTHDSIGLGEDGPTHQPIEHAAMLRLTPGLSVWRPCDAIETAAAWYAALKRTDGPTALLLTRQNLAVQERMPAQLGLIHQGGYILKECDGAPHVILIATGSEVSLAVAAATKLHEQNIRVRVVSMPSVDVFRQQSNAYKESVLPSHITKRVAIEAGVTGTWYEWVGTAGRVIGLDRFGESAPAEVLFDYFGFNTTHVVDVVKNLFA